MYFSLTDIHLLGFQRAFNMRSQGKSAETVRPPTVPTRGSQLAHLMFIRFFLSTSRFVFILLFRKHTVKTASPFHFLHISIRFRISCNYSFFLCCYFSIPFNMFRSAFIAFLALLFRFHLVFLLVVFSVML